MSLLQPCRRHSVLHHQCGNLELQRFLGVTLNEQRFKLQPQPGRELPGACVCWRTFFLRQGYKVWQRRMRIAFRRNHRSHAGPIVCIWRTVVSQREKRRVGNMPGLVVVIASVMIIRTDRRPDAADQCQVMCLFGQQRQVFAQLNVRCSGSNRIERATVFGRSIRFHIPHVDVRSTATEEKQNRRFRFPTGRRVRQFSRRRVAGATEAQTRK